MKKGILDNNFVFMIMLLSLIGSSLVGIILVKEFTGFAGTLVPADAGTITTIVMDDRQPTSYWHGLFGLVFSQTGFNESQSTVLSAGVVSTFTAVFDCIDPEIEANEMYASLNPTVDFSNVVPGTTDMIDVDLLNLSSGSVDRANTSFIYNQSVLLGSTNISWFPAAYTYVNDAPDSTGKFFTGILNASGELLMVIRVYSDLTGSFKGTNIDYQALLPIFNSTDRWYFFPDPNDECPLGFGTGQLGDSIIQGYVNEVNSTIPIVNVLVAAGGNSSLTDSTGFYNFSAPGGFQHLLLAIKEGYIVNITSINTTIGQTTFTNLTMARFFGYVGPNGTISGYVRDNSTGSPIANTTVSIAGYAVTSNATGNYSLNVQGGVHVIAAVSDGYRNFVNNFTISTYQNLSYIINMTPALGNEAAANGTTLNNGTIQGYIIDNSTGLPLANVTVTVAGSSNLSDASGFYNLSALQGTTNLVAVLTGYDVFAQEVNITAQAIINFNFSMTPVETAPDTVVNGSVTGTVTSSSGSPLQGITVSIVGQSNDSNTTGGFLLNDVPPGTHVIAATGTGYENYVSTVNITTAGTTTHDITMTTTTEAGLGAGSGAGQGAGQGSGQGAGQGAGQGPGTGIQAQIQQVIEVDDYLISVKEIIKKLMEGSYIETPISITNFKEESVDIAFSVEGDVKNMARINKNRMIIEGGDTAEVRLTLLGNVEPGIYEGVFVISGDINEEIPIYVLVQDRDRLSVESLIIRTTPEKRKVRAGELFKYTVDLQNLLSEEEYKVTLTYTLEGITENKTFFLETEDIVIQTSFSMLKSFRVPIDFEVGDYALKIKAQFLNLESEHSTIFTVTEPLYKYAVFGFIPLWIIMLLVGTLSTGTFSVYYYKKRAASKKRYKIELDLNTLPKPGSRSAYMGNVAETKTKAYFDMDTWQVHSLIAGSSGSGKSIVAQDMVEEALLKNTAVVVFDPTAQWTGFLRKLEDKGIINTYKNYGMKKTDARPFNGNVHQVENGRELLEFKKIMKPGEINIFVINKLDTKDIDLLVSNTIKGAFHGNLPESKEMKYLIIYDGIHSLLPKFGGSGQVFTQIERATREFRKWGIGLILISQVLSDFPPEVLANINTEIQMRTRDEGDLNRTKEKYGPQILQSVVKAAQGTGVVQNSNYNKGKPYFIAFRPPMHSTSRISDEELQNYNKYNVMIEDLEYQLDQLEKDKIDVFDLRLELKLSQDKVKSGNFNMVAIYLDGLKPRIKAQWDKLGKQPKKKEVKFFSEGKLKEELAKAKEGRKKYKGEQEKAKEAAKEKENSEPKGEEKPKEETEQKSETENKIESAEHPSLKSEPEHLDAFSQVESIETQIKELMSGNNRPEAVKLYSKVQEIYKNTPKESKGKMMARCVEIQKLLSGK